MLIHLAWFTAVFWESAFNLRTTRDDLMYSKAPMSDMNNTIQVH